MSGADRSMGMREALSVLNLASNADPRGLRAAYLSAVKAAHPDRVGGDAERLRAVIEAYELLRSRPSPLHESPGREPPPRESPGRPLAEAVERRASVRRPPPSRQVHPLEITPDEAARGGVRSVELEGRGPVSVRLPPGLRVGDHVGVFGAVMVIAIAGDGDLVVVGDHLCMTVQVDRAILTRGGSITVAAPGGPITAPISRQDGLRGLTRIAGAGLPPRGDHGQGHLFVRLEPAVSSADETAARSLLRRFTAAWAA